jgi:peptidylprolyl isomerase
MVKKANKKIQKEIESKMKQDKEFINTKWPDAITTETGLKYIVIKKGKGKKPVKGTKIKVHYIGKLLNGKIFDSSIDRGQPIEFEVGIGRVIKGWDEALLDMKKEEKRILIIPPNLAYGKRGAGSAIPPDAILIFEVELIAL